MEEKGKTIKVLELLGLIFGLVGSGVTLISLFLPAFTMDSFLGHVETNMFKYWGVFVIIYFLILGMGIMLSLMKSGVVSIVNGSANLLFTILGLVAQNINLSNSNALVKNMVTVGAGIYFLFFASALMIASGILYLIAFNYKKAAGLPEEEAKKRATFKKVIIIVYSSIVGVVILVTGLAIIIGKVNTKKHNEMARINAEAFMECALNGDSENILSYVSDDCRDTSGFLEAYDADLLIDSFMLYYGGRTVYDSLTIATQDQIRASMDNFAVNYIESYTINSLEYDHDEEAYKISVNVVMFNEHGTSEVNVESLATARTEQYLEDNFSMLMNLMATGGEEALYMKIYEDLMPEFIEATEESWRSMGVTDAEITLTMVRTDDVYEITAIEVN